MEHYPLTFITADINFYELFLLLREIREIISLLDQNVEVLKRIMSANFSKYPVTFKQTHLQSLLFPNHPGTTFTKTFALSNRKCLPTIPSFQHQPRSGCQDFDKMPYSWQQNHLVQMTAAHRFCSCEKEESADFRTLSRQKGTRASLTGSQSNTKVLDCIHVNPPNILSCLFSLLVNFAQGCSFPGGFDAVSHIELPAAETTFCWAPCKSRFPLSVCVAYLFFKIAPL